jgi:hypothetical protein
MTLRQNLPIRNGCNVRDSWIASHAQVPGQGLEPQSGTVEGILTALTGLRTGIIATYKGHVKHMPCSVTEADDAGQISWVLVEIFIVIHTHHCIDAVYASTHQH